MFKNFHVKYIEVSQDIFNHYLNVTRNYNTVYIAYEKFNEKNYSARTRFIENKRLNISLVFKIGGKWRAYKTNKAKKYLSDSVRMCDPIKAYAEFSRIVKPFPWNNLGEGNINNLAAYSDCHPEKQGFYEYAISYDVNKAFWNAARNNLMPGHLLRKYDKPTDGEIGFTCTGIPILGKSNIVCTYVFDLIINERLNKYLDLKLVQLNSAKTDEEKKYIKNCVNMSIGNLANHNPFLRNAIIFYQNRFIESKVDSNTIWSNTDSIVSCVKRDDLVIGNQIGQFKIEHEGRFLHAVTGYQWLDEGIVKNKGISQDQIRLYNATHDKKFLLGEDNEKIKNFLLYEFIDGRLVKL